MNCACTAVYCVLYIVHAQLYIVYCILCMHSCILCSCVLCMHSCILCIVYCVCTVVYCAVVYCVWRYTIPQHLLIVPIIGHSFNHLLNNKGALSTRTLSCESTSDPSLFNMYVHVYVQHTANPCTHCTASATPHKVIQRWGHSGNDEYCDSRFLRAVCLSAQGLLFRMQE